MNGGECAWDQPAGNFSAIGKCSEGVYGEGIFCECGICWKKNEIEPCVDTKCQVILKNIYKTVDIITSDSPFIELFMSDSQLYVSLKA